MVCNLRLGAFGPSNNKIYIAHFTRKDCSRRLLYTRAGLNTEYPVLQSCVCIVTWFTGELATVTAFFSYLCNKAKVVMLSIWLISW